jgi:tetratricopeptide (TPR) repeat protein
MKFIRKLLARRRLGEAARRVAEDPSALNYAHLIQLFAAQDRLQDALQAVSEGLALHPRDAELRRLQMRVLRIQREGRTRELQQLLQELPRPAVYRELVELMLEDGRAAQAEELVAEWLAKSDGPQPRYWRARARCMRYFADRLREDGTQALAWLEDAEQRSPQDEALLRLTLEFHGKIGAWTQARRALSRLLELRPGDLALEARFRTISALAVLATEPARCLAEVERQGRFVGEDQQVAQGSSVQIRPVLQSLTRERGVKAAFFVRGATALVQGPRGYTAERSARGICEMLQSTRNASRRLGLGQLLELRIEGDFGALAALPGEEGSGVLWLDAPALTKRMEDGLRELSGLSESKASGVGR